MKRIIFKFNLGDISCLFLFLYDLNIYKLNNIKSSEKTENKIITSWKLCERPKIRNICEIRDLQKKHLSSRDS